jgi:hypothetical protein
MYVGSVSGTIIATGAQFVSTSTSGYTSFSFPLSYTTTGVPDVCIINVTMIGPVAGPDIHSGSNFLVDDITLSGISTTSVPLSSASPTSFALEQNYPNPFNPTTRIAYVIPPGAGGGSQVAASENMVPSTTYHIRLTIYDLVGREVAALVDGVQAPGRHEVKFDASNLSTGVYLYRLQVGSFAETRRMTLLK